MLTTSEPEYTLSAPLGATEDAAQARPTDENGNFIYRIPESNLASMNAKVDKLNKRARRLGMSPIVVAEIREEFVTRRKRIDDPFGGPAKVEEITVRFVTLTVTGQTPRIDGWDFAATVQHEEGGNLLRTCPDFDTLLLLRYRQADTQCEHCAKDRRRNDTYVLFNADAGTWKQVGRSCLADFLRTTSPQAIAEWAETIAALDSDISAYENDFSDGEGGGGRKLYFGVQHLLAQVRRIVRQDGWCSRGEARNSFIPKRVLRPYFSEWSRSSGPLPAISRRHSRFVDRHEGAINGRAGATKADFGGTPRH